MSRLPLPLSLAALSLAAAAPLAAQSDVRAVRFGVQGGAALPTGEFGDVTELGFLVAGTADWRLANRPFGLRFDVGYQRNAFKDVPPGLGIDLDPVSIVSGTANVVATVPTASGVRPYVLGGAGVYHVRISGSFGFDGEFDGPISAAAQSESSSDSETKPGLQLGGGLSFNLGALDAYVEARYHTVFTSDERISYVPIVFGLRF